MRTLVIVPTYNEAESIRSIIDRIRRAVPEADILIVDDGSPDGTGGIADELAARDAHIDVLHRPEKAGLGAAYLHGFARAFEGGYEAVVEIDADGSHDPAELPAMLGLLESGPGDLVIGSRWVDGGRVVNWPWPRRAISRSGNRYARWMLRSSIHDLTAGFRAYRTSALRGLDRAVVSSQGYCFQVELAWRVESAGGAVLEHPIAFVERENGSSKMGPGIVAEALVRVTGWGLSARFGRGPIHREATP
ncbi:polyprenol monophosphomannose synthase [Microcella sp.]|uniref:polyprenol monophosphomannose synthase n=1 Tax=Microcella sp. TaxID=1913979 RepID=UPI003F70E373